MSCFQVKGVFNSTKKVIDGVVKSRFSLDLSLLKIIGGPQVLGSGEDAFELD